MWRRIVLVLVAVALVSAGLGVGHGSAAASQGSTGAARSTASGSAEPRSGQGPAVVTEVRSVTTEMDCAGYLEEITVSARLPRTVGTGQAFTIAELTTTQMGGSVHLGLTHASTETVSVAAYRPPSTLQVVATGRPGQRVELHVTGATHIGVHDNSPPSVSRTDCTPVGDTQLGNVLIGRLPRRDAATGVVDVAVPLTCRSREGFDVGGEVVHVGFTAPTRLRPGEAFTLADLSPTDTPAGALGPVVHATGTDHTTTVVTPSSVLTVTAAPGETVDILLRLAVAFDGPEIHSTCTPLTSGLLASVPVVGSDA